MIIERNWTLQKGIRITKLVMVNKLSDAKRYQLKWQNSICSRQRRKSLDYFCAAFELIHTIGYTAHSFRNFKSGMNNGGRNRQLEGCFARQYVFEDLQRWNTSRWLTTEPYHNRNNNISKYNFLGERKRRFFIWYTRVAHFLVNLK